MMASSSMKRYREVSTRVTYFPSTYSQSDVIAWARTLSRRKTAICWSAGMAKLL